MILGWCTLVKAVNSLRKAFDCTSSLTATHLIAASFPLKLPKNVSPNEPLPITAFLVICRHSTNDTFLGLQLAQICSQTWLCKDKTWCSLHMSQRSRVTKLYHLIRRHEPACRRSLRDCLLPFIHNYKKIYEYFSIRYRQKLRELAD